MSTDVERDAEEILVAHQRRRGGCLCGGVGLGESHPRHLVAVLREAGLLTESEKS